MLPDGERVGHRLAGVMVVGQAVDDGDGGARREVDHVGLGEGADHDGVEVAREYVAGVFEGLADAQLNVAGAQKERLGAELGDADLERDARARRGLGEDHADRLALEQAVRLAALLGGLQFGCQVEQRADLGRRVVMDGKKVPAFEAQVGDAVPQRGHVASLWSRRRSLSVVGAGRPRAARPHGDGSDANRGAPERPQTQMNLCSRRTSSRVGWPISCRS